MKKLIKVLLFYSVCIACVIGLFFAFSNADKILPDYLNSNMTFYTEDRYEIYSKLPYISQGNVEIYPWNYFSMSMKTEMQDVDVYAFIDVVTEFPDHVPKDVFSCSDNTYINKLSKMVFINNLEYIDINDKNMRADLVYDISNGSYTLIYNHVMEVNDAEIDNIVLEEKRDLLEYTINDFFRTNNIIPCASSFGDYYGFEMYEVFDAPQYDNYYDSLFYGEYEFDEADKENKYFDYLKMLELNPYQGLYDSNNKYTKEMIKKIEHNAFLFDDFFNNIYKILLDNYYVYHYYQDYNYYLNAFMNNEYHIYINGNELMIIFYKDYLNAEYDFVIYYDCVNDEFSGFVMH